MTTATTKKTFQPLSLTAATMIVAMSSKDLLRSAATASLYHDLFVDNRTDVAAKSDPEGAAKLIEVIDIQIKAFSDASTAAGDDADKVAKQLQAVRDKIEEQQLASANGHTAAETEQPGAGIAEQQDRQLGGGEAVEQQ